MLGSGSPRIRRFWVVHFTHFVGVGYNGLIKRFGMMIVALLNLFEGRERDYWMGTEIGMLGGYGFQGQVTAGDLLTTKTKREQDAITSVEKEQAAVQGGTKGERLQLKSA